MTAYDQAGHVSRTPAGDFNARDDAMSAPGSNPSRTVPWDAPIDPAGVTGDPSGIAIELTIPGAHKTGSSVVAGQNDPSVITPVSAESIVSTGAGQGDNFADQNRYEWQQKPGG